MELCPPFDGWHLDVDGIIHTPSGYRCTPAQIESALWLRDGIVNDRARHTIFADTPQVEPRRLAEARDWIGEDIGRLQIVARRHRCTCCKGALGDVGNADDDGRFPPISRHGRQG